MIVRTNNFARMRWLGHPIWQNVLDLWTIQETLAYAPMVTVGSFLIVQDGLIDTLPGFGTPPGPLVAIRDFVRMHPEFVVDRAKSKRFPCTHHPSGWLRRRAA